MRGMSFLYASASEKDVHIVTGFRKVWDDPGYGCLVCEVGTVDGGFAAEFLYLLIGCLVTLISLVRSGISKLKSTVQKELGVPE